MKEKKTVLFLFILSLCLMLAGCGANEKTGGVTIRVLDGFTSMPIAGASVTVPETDGRFLTGEDGRTCEMLLPVIPDGEYDKLLPSGAGRISFIVNAKGYTPYLLLYARVKPGGTRSIDILLFPDDGTLPVFTVIEAPDEAWCAEIIRRYSADHLALPK